MNVERKSQTSGFQCATCGAPVDFVKEIRRTAQRDIVLNSYQCSTDSSHHVGELVIPGADEE
ncbi:hypothetical protein [Nocardioides sp. L-11A]|uniref:hypothetical protein n=1 Tax=Nocardioides sp. L-11A TaxID=3043848 RepID=UPI00249AB9CC|nr:hypothetical protein QJ852_06440 [Nocardioides sp. L-11A]